VQNQPVVGVPPERLGDDFLELCLDLVDRLSRRQTGAITDSENVSVDRKGLLAESRVENDISGLAADAGQSLQFFASAWNFAAMMVDQRLAERDDILRLGIEQPDRLDRITQIILAEINHLSRRLDMSEQGARRDVDAGVRRLCGKHDGDQKLVGTARFELGCRRGIGFRQPAEEFENLLALH